jgi:hypothetical protein
MTAAGEECYSRASSPTYSFVLANPIQVAYDSPATHSQENRARHQSTRVRHGTECGGKGGGKK